MTHTLAPAHVPIRSTRSGSGRSRRTSGGGRPRWSGAVLVAAILCAAPVVAVLADAVVGRPSTWPRGLGEMTLTTLQLMVGVGLATLVVGGGLAWLVTAYDFWLRDLMVWLLVLPLAVPAYILGFVFLSTFDEAGSVQRVIRDLTGSDAGFSVRGLPGCIVVMTCALYPYVYLLARAAFVEQTASAYDAARVLGAGNRRIFWRVLIPLARPSLAAGLGLVMMEVLTDFATVQYFGVQTVSFGVYTTWRTTYDFAAAVQLATVVLGFALSVLAAERLLRGRAAFTQQSGRGSGRAPTRLRGWRAGAATSACLLALALGFAIPVARLVAWAIQTFGGSGEGGAVDARLIGYVVNSLVIATGAALTCVAVAVVMAHAVRLGAGPLVRAAAQATTVGYAVPGAVVGIGVLLLLAAIDAALRTVGVAGGTGLLVTGSLAAVLYGYAVRFMGPAYQAVDASFAKLPAQLTQSALSLGASPWRVLTRVNLPLARSGVLVALVMVAIDAVKELPLMLLLRPFGFTTASVWVYQLASENLWRLAALPALVIVAIASIPVAVLFKQVRAADLSSRAAVASGQTEVTP